MITSVNIFEISLAVSLSNSLFNAIIPPNADTESHLKAFLYAEFKLSPVATPHGFACLIIATADFKLGSNSETNSNAALVSFMLL